MKKWRSIDDQLRILEDRGMIITDRERANASLERFGYYRLSGYWYPFRAREENGDISNRFIPHTHLSEIVDLYVFDKRLRLLALDALERIELALQVNVAHTLGELDPAGHTKPEFLNQRFVQNGAFDTWSGKYADLKDRAGSRTFVRHNLDTYGELPLWAAVEIFDFGTLSHLFKMLRRRERDQIAAKYGLSGGHILEQWLKSLTYVRNVSAHHERLWNNNIKDTSDVPRQFIELSRTNQYRTFRYFCIMQFFMKQLCPNSTWKDRVREHLLAFPTPRNQQVTVADLGVVQGWENWQLWRPRNEN